MRKKITTITFGLLALSTACSDLNIAPTDRVAEINYWNKPADALNVLTSCYENMYSADYFFFTETLRQRLQRSCRWRKHPGHCRRRLRRLQRTRHQRMELSL